jgi:predicted HAD superfamily Cof-like phosphohydrolase
MAGDMSNCDCSKCKPPARGQGSASISDAQAKVREFHRKFGVTSPDKVLRDYEVDWFAHIQRAKWIIDEAMEIVDACMNCDVPALADAYGDIKYFAHGGDVELGVDGAQVFDAIHEANMRKVKLPGVVKIAKPEGWTPPDIAALIEAQRNRK